MNVEFNNVAETPEGRFERIKKSISKRGATIFSRLESYNECVAIVPTDSINDDSLFYFVWLNGEGGLSYVSGDKPQHIDKIVQTLISGTWKHQPNAKIILES